MISDKVPSRSKEFIVSRSSINLALSTQHISCITKQNCSVYFLPRCRRHGDVLHIAPHYDGKSPARLRSTWVFFAQSVVVQINFIEPYVHCFNRAFSNMKNKQTTKQNKNKSRMCGYKRNMFMVRLLLTIRVTLHERYGLSDHQPLNCYSYDCSG